MVDPLSTYSHMAYAGNFSGADLHGSTVTPTDRSRE